MTPEQLAHEAAEKIMMIDRLPSLHRSVTERAEKIICTAIRKAIKPMPMPASHPEDYCEKCGGPNITWFVASPLWNKYAREQYGIICPVCFALLAEEAGYMPTAWQLVPENPPPSNEELSA